jgi:hypothetical protein
VELDKWSSPALLKITHNGSGNFKVYNLNSNGERINLLVFTNGSYDGYLPLDFWMARKPKVSTLQPTVRENYKSSRLGH